MDNLDSFLRGDEDATPPFTLTNFDPIKAKTSALRRIDLLLFPGLRLVFRLDERRSLDFFQYIPQASPVSGSPESVYGCSPELDNRGGFAFLD